MEKKILRTTVIITLLGVVLGIIIGIGIASHGTFDTSTLETWCGGSSGRVRMVGAWMYDDHGLEDETGNVWDYEGPIDGQAFYLLWIDDMGTSSVEDDQIVKVWKEV